MGQGKPEWVANGGHFEKSQFLKIPNTWNQTPFSITTSPDAVILYKKPHMPHFFLPECSLLSPSHTPQGYFSTPGESEFLRNQTAWHSTSQKLLLT